MIKYRHGYKYQLAEDYSLRTGIFPAAVIEDDFILLDRSGLLTLKKGYAWDGASGIALDTKSFMRGSLVHDALYQLMNDGKLSQQCKRTADVLLVDICREDGMGRFRAWYVLKAVSTFGGKYAASRDKSASILAAP